MRLCQLSAYLQVEYLDKVAEFVPKQFASGYPLIAVGSFPSGFREVIMELLAACDRDINVYFTADNIAMIERKPKRAIRSQTESRRIYMDYWTTSQDLAAVLASWPRHQSTR